jgi:LPPG:FO 2-phospho-L-lactate transferase
MRRIVALCGGVGGAKLAYGLSQILGPEELSLIVNTGDDFEHLGLTICPDIDTVMYTLAGKENAEYGWGRNAESWHVMEELAVLHSDTWFKLGDKDIALHLTRRQLLDRGKTLTQVTHELAARLAVRHRILPMSDAPLRTMVLTEQGELAFQDYFVRLRCEPAVVGFRFAGDDSARASSEVIAALGDQNLSGVVICPSNPYVSIGPILAVADIRRALGTVSAPIIAVSPIVGGRALKGPAGKMMSELGKEVSSLAVARHYGDLLNALVIDEQDRALTHNRKASDPEFIVAQTVMKTREDRIALARECVELLHKGFGARHSNFSSPE